MLITSNDIQDGSSENVHFKSSDSANNNYEGDKSYFR